MKVEMKTVLPMLSVLCHMPCPIYSTSPGPNVQSNTFGCSFPSEGYTLRVQISDVLCGLKSGCSSGRATCQQ